MGSAMRRFMGRIDKACILVAGLALAGGALAGFPEARADDWHVSNEYSLTYNDLGGPGKDSSALTEGGRYMNVIAVDANGQLGEFDYLFNLGMRQTNDERLAPRTSAFTTLQGSITNRVHTLNLGDTFEAFSQYSLNTVVKGGSYRYVGGDYGLPAVTLVCGYANPRWDNFFSAGDGTEDAIDRKVYGARIAHELSDKFSAGISYVQTNDVDRLLADDDLYDTRTCGLDFEYLPIPGLSIRGESSYGDSSLSPSRGGVDVDEKGAAHRLTVVGDGAPSKVTIEYERVDPEYLTLAGSATPDREKVRLRWRYKPTRRRSLTTGILWYRDDLDHHKEFRTDHIKPEIRYRRTRPFDRRYAAATVSYKVDVKKKDRDKRVRTDHIVNMNYRDRFGIFDTDTNLGFNSYRDIEYPRGKDVEVNANTSIFTRHTLGSVVLKPQLNLGGFSLDRDELVETSDRISEYSLGLGLDVPDANVSSHVRAGVYRLNKEGGEDNQRSFASLACYWRPDFFARLDYAMLYARAALNDYDFRTEENNFSEHSVTAGINIQF